MKIEQIDMLVHPDFNIFRAKDPFLSDKHKDRREAWEKRAVEISNNPKAVLFYFSIFVNAFRHTDTWFEFIGTEEQKVFEKARLDRFAKLLGDRFFPYPGLYCPERSEVLQSFQERNMRYVSARTNLFAYGEYAAECVSQWGKHMSLVLNLRAKKLYYLSDLSLERSNDPNRFQKRSEAEIQSKKDLAQSEAHFPIWMSLFR